MDKRRGYRRSRPQEVVYVDTRLLQYCPQRALGQVAGVVWQCCIPICAGVEPDFMAAGSLPVELESAQSQLSSNLSITKPCQTTHSGGHYNRVVAPFARAG